VKSHFYVVVILSTGALIHCSTACEISILLYVKKSVGILCVDCEPYYKGTMAVACFGTAHAVFLQHSKIFSVAGVLVQTCHYKGRSNSCVKILCQNFCQ